MRFIQSLKLAGLLSFPPDMEPFELESLNVLIGPNGSGKSNLIEAFELLRALPADFAKPLREGGGISEWLWKGQAATDVAQIELKTGTGFPIPVSVRYRIDFGARLCALCCEAEGVLHPPYLVGRNYVWFPVWRGAR